jgi:iron(II)-dependent oxidoreductase
MRQGLTIVVLTIAGVFGGIGLVLGILQANLVICAGAAIGLCYVGACFAPLVRRHSVRATRESEEGPVAAPKRQRGDEDTAEVDQAGGRNGHGIAAKMITAGRYALLLHAQVTDKLTDAERKKALATLRKSMALVPAGLVLMRHGNDEYDANDQPGARHVMKVDAVYLDRFCVTNLQYRAFIVGGGYEEAGLWDPDIWPGVVNFVDRTGRPGPRFWHEGTYPRGEDHHPIVGISWFEAMAYTRWAGKRLPTEAEWLRAAGWPVSVGDKPPVQRKYPWGDAMDRRRANLWGSGPGRTVAVNSLPEGASAGGVYQMSGNVWEWTSGDYGTGLPMGDDFELLATMKSIRGGAFDTYFENQAANHFRSGEKPLSRTANIGFRCALSACDVAEEPEDRAPAEAVEDGEPIAAVCVKEQP